MSEGWGTVYQLERDRAIGNDPDSLRREIERLRAGVDKRRTGRTTRMIEDAKRLQTEGRAVYVIAASAHHAKILKQMLPPDSTINVETPESCGNFDWQTLSLRGAHPNCAVLVDHFAIESRFAPLLRMLTAYDSR